MSNTNYCPQCGDFLTVNRGFACCHTCNKIMWHSDGVSGVDALKIRRKRRAVRIACVVGFIIIVAMNTFPIWWPS